MNRLRVLIAEDHEDIRGILVSFLNPDFQVIGEVADGEQLVEAASLLEPDIIISDIGMPVMDGFSAKDILRSNGMKCPFVFVTMMDLRGWLSSSVEEVPVGYVHKNDLFSELKVAVRTVAFGNSYVSRSFRG